ncbi:MAG: hypothetical protein HY455_02620 [Parcubacteria group bacterium]|nr:hypothetical protein [Parcubacteria group bacterium]
MLPDILEKVKVAFRTLDRQEDWFIIALIILVGFGGFGLGRLSTDKEARESIQIEQNTSLGALGSVNDLGGAILGQVVASRNGGKYHFPWCSGAARITETNKVWFQNEEDAQKAGYTPASNCPGLK